MGRSLTEKIVKNTAFNAVGRFWGILTALLLTPYILGHIGIERYGVWGIVGALTGYFRLLDFGMGTAFVKYIAEYHATKDREKINQVLSTGVAFYCVFALLLVPLAFLAMDPLLGLFRIPPELAGEVAFVFRLGVLVFAVSNIFTAFQAVQSGLQRMDLTNKISLGASVPLILGTVYFLETGHGLRGLMVNNAIVMALTGAAHALAAVRLFPGLKLGPALVTGEMFRKMFGFGFKLQSAKLADAVVFQADRLLVAHFLGVARSGLYQLGASAAYNVRGVPLLLVSALMPAASDLDARLEREKLRLLYVKSTKYLALAGFPLVFFIIAAAPLLMQAWLGPGYGGSALVLRFLAAGYLVNLLSGAGTSVGAAVGKPEFQLGASVISAVLALVFCLGLIPAAGFPGAAIGTSAALVFGTFYFFAKLHGLLELSLRRALFDTFAAPLRAALLPALATGALHYWLKAPLAGAGRPASLALLAAEAAVFTGVYLAGIRGSGYLDEHDRRLLRRAASCLWPGPAASGRGEAPL